MRLLEHVLDRDVERPWELPKRPAELVQQAVGERVAVHMLYALAEAIRGVVEVVQKNILEAELAKLRDRFERGRVKSHIGYQR
jgi:hypothetical protein